MAKSHQTHSSLQLYYIQPSGLAFSLQNLFQGIKRRTGSTGISVQFSSVAQSCPPLCDPMDRSTPGLPVHHQLLELAQTRVHRGSDAIQPSHPLSSPSPPALNLSQHQGLFLRGSYLHQVARVLELSFVRNV